MAEVTFTDKQFDEQVMQAEHPVLVDFWAEWCGPCRMQGPIIEELAKELDGKPVSIGKMNVDENPETPSKLGIMSIPTLIIFKGGQEAERLVGVQSKEVLLEKLNNLMN